jgi:hypothetical protein
MYVSQTQALSFLNAHRETILLLLKEPSPILPLPLIKEFHLLATLLNFVLPKVDFKDLVSTGLFLRPSCLD